MDLVKGNIVTESYEIVGSYFKITSTRYNVKLNGNYREMTEEQLETLLDELELYTEPDWN